MEKRKKIMILGAGRGQIGLIKAARRLGYHTIATSIAGDYPGFKLADEICIADIASPEEVYKAAAEQNVDGIATACMDVGLKALSYSCQQLGLTGLSQQAAQISNDKRIMKEFFSSPRCFNCSLLETFL